MVGTLVQAWYMVCRMLHTATAGIGRTGQGNTNPSQWNLHLQRDEEPTEEYMEFIKDEDTLAVASLSQRAAQMQSLENQCSIIKQKRKRKRKKWRHVYANEVWKSEGKSSSEMCGL